MSLRGRNTTLHTTPAANQAARSVCAVASAEAAYRTSQNPFTGGAKPMTGEPGSGLDSRQDEIE